MTNKPSPRTSWCIAALLVVGVSTLAWFGVSGWASGGPQDNVPAAQAEAGEHDGHDHAEHDHADHDHAAEEAAGEHDDHDHADHDPAVEEAAGERDDHDEHHVELSEEQRQRIGLKLEVAGPGQIGVAAAFPGEVMLDPDRVVHVVPRAAGIVREVHKTLGDRVAAGEVLAWIESDELAEAKLDFYARQAEVGRIQLELPRARAIFENTNRLLDLLERDPAEKDLRALEGLEMGEYRGRLIKAYAQYMAAKATYDRERALHAKKISSEQELIEAESALKQAQAELAATRDTVRYEVLVAYAEAARERQVAEFEAAAAEQRLRLRGAAAETVAALDALVPEAGSLKPRDGDPSSTEGEPPSVHETVGHDQRFGWYALVAPGDGVITDKHLSLGEKVGTEESVFTLADTSSVWVRFSVYQKDLARVRPGQEAFVEIVNDGRARRSGLVAYVDPIVDKESRTAGARIVLDNADDALRPGLFASVHVAVDSVEAPVVIPKAAVQVLEEREVVFVEDGDGFSPIPVTLGLEDATRVAIASGLAPGQRYVASGGFEMKAKVVTSGLGAHAGHGH